MKTFQIPFILFFALLVCTLAWAGGRQGQGGPEARGARDYQGYQGNQGYMGSQGRGGPMAQNQRMYGGPGGSDSKKYRSNLYSDDEVYGYDATYPNGEASYINYKSKEARSRRGPEFARTSRAYSRQGGGGGGRGGEEGGYGRGMQQEYGGNGNGHKSGGW